jgi:hypothetical protein
MATVVDSLIVELGLDPSKFTKGQKEAAASFAKTKEEIRKTGKDIEDAGKKSGESIGIVAKEALALFGIFATARGVKDFVADLVATDSALGRFAANLGATSQTAGAWGLAAERMGGSAEATGASVQGLFDKLMAMKNLGKNMPMEYWMLGARGGVELDRSKGVYEQMFQLATAIQNIAAREGRPTASWWGRTIGLDEGTINTILEKGPKLREYIESLKTLAPSSENVAASQKLLDVWVRLKQEAIEFGRELTMKYAPAIEAASKALSDLMKLFKAIEPITTKFVQVITFGGLALGDMVKFFEKLSAAIAYAADKLKGFVGYLGEMKDSVTSLLKDNQITRFLGIGAEPSPGSAPAQESTSQPGFFRRQYNKARDWLGGGKEDSPAAPGASSSASPSGQGSASESTSPGGIPAAGGLDRSRFARELAQNPALRRKIMAIAAGENMHPTGNQAVLETMMNRASLMGTSLAYESRLHGSEKGYYAGYNPSALNNPRTTKMIDDNLNKVLAGSNVSNYATDNSSAAWGRNRIASGMYTQDSAYGGEYYSHPSPSRSDARGYDRYRQWRAAQIQGAQAASWQPSFEASNWPMAGGYQGAQLAASSMSANSSVSNSSAEANFHGPITVNTQATDAHGMARDMMPALMESSRYVSQMNGGPQ